MALSFSGSINPRKVIKQPLTGGVSFVGTQPTPRIVQHYFISLSGVLLLGRILSGGLTSILSFSGALTARHIFGRLLVAGLSLTGSFTGVHIFIKNMTGALSFAGNWFAERAVHLLELASTLSYAGQLTVTRLAGRFVQVFTGAVSFSGKVSRSVGYRLAAALSFATALSLTAIGFFLQAFTAGLTFTGQYSRAIIHRVFATLPLVGAIPKSVQRLWQATLPLPGSSFRTPLKNFVASLPLVVTFTTSEIVNFFTQNFTAALSWVGTNVRFTRHKLTASLPLTGSLPRLVQRIIQGVLIITGIAARRARRGLNAVLTSNAAFVVKTAFITLLEAALNFTGGFQGLLQHLYRATLTATLSLAGSVNFSLSQLFTILLSAGLTFATTISRLTHSLLTGRLIFIGALQELFRRHPRPQPVVPPSYIDVRFYTGAEDHWLPWDIRNQRVSTLQTMRRLGAAVLIKRMYTIEDVENGIAIESPTMDDIYHQSTYAIDELSHGVGYVSVETQDGEWYNPVTGDLYVNATNPDPTFLPAPRYRGFGPGFLTYAMFPDRPEDVWKLTPQGTLIRQQTAMVQLPWWPQAGDNDLLITCRLARNGLITQTYERYQLKMVTPVTMHGLDRGGNREFEVNAGGNRFWIGQQAEATKLPTNDPTYTVETDR